MELNKNDLLRLLSYLEGELQARDVVIAALKVGLDKLQVQMFKCLTSDRQGIACRSDFIPNHRPIGFNMC